MIATLRFRSRRSNTAVADEPFLYLKKNYNGAYPIHYSLTNNRQLKMYNIFSLRDSTTQPRCINRISNAIGSSRIR